MRFAISAVAAASGLVLLGLAFYGQPAAYLHQAREQWDALMDRPPADQPLDPETDANREHAAQLQQEVAQLEEELATRQPSDARPARVQPPMPHDNASQAVTQDPNPSGFAVQSSDATTAPAAPSPTVAQPLPSVAVTPPDPVASPSPAASAQLQDASPVLPPMPTPHPAIAATPAASAPPLAEPPPKSTATALVVPPLPVPPLAVAPPIPPAAVAPPISSVAVAPSIPAVPAGPPGSPVAAAPAGPTVTARPSIPFVAAAPPVSPPAETSHAHPPSRASAPPAAVPSVVVVPERHEADGDIALNRPEPSRTEPSRTDAIRADAAKTDAARPAQQRQPLPRPVPPPPPLPQVSAPRQEADDTQSVLARLRQGGPGNAPPPQQLAELQPQNEPKPRPVALPALTRLNTARAALADGRIDEARRLLQEAQLELVFRPVDTLADGPASAGRGAADVAHALEALSASDVPLSRRYIDVAVGDLSGTGNSPPIQESSRRASGYAPAYPPR